MHLLYLTFGENLSNHIEAHFSICSFLTQREEIKTINVITDKPRVYKDLAHHINIISVDEKKLNEWKGDYNFFWRIKIKAIEMLCDLYKKEPVMYLDADTFLYKNIFSLKKQLLQGMAFMHEDEGRLALMKGKTVKKMWLQIKEKVYGGEKILPTHTMWNAGVVATPNNKNNKECLLALAICDEMCKQKVTPRLIEQFALSVALSKIYGLGAADNTIAHYWSNKNEWDKLIETFFISAHFKSINVEEMAEAFKKLSLDKIALKVKIKDTNKNLKNFIEKVYPKKNIAFIKPGF